MTAEEKAAAAAAKAAAEAAAKAAKAKAEPAAKVYRITAPNAEYNGISASVQFKNGEGETTSHWLAQWFTEHGYEVTEGEATEKKEG